MEKSRYTVLSFLKALNEEDFDQARRLMNDNAAFRGVLENRDGADNYIAELRKIKLKYGVLKVFSDAHEVCIWYNINMAGRAVLTCGWYQLLHDKISNIRVLFDPRPFIENVKL